MKPYSILEEYTIINLRIAEFFLVGQGETIGQCCVIYTYSIPYLIRCSMDLLLDSLLLLVICQYFSRLLVNDIRKSLHNNNCAHIDILYIYIYYMQVSKNAFALSSLYTIIQEILEQITESLQYF